MMCVLILAGTESIFFIVAGTVLYFGFSIRIMLIALCFICCKVVLILS